CSFITLNHWTISGVASLTSQATSVLSRSVMILFIPLALSSSGLISHTLSTCSLGKNLLSNLCHLIHYLPVPLYTLTIIYKCNACFKVNRIITKIVRQITLYFYLWISLCTFST